MPPDLQFGIVFSPAVEFSQVSKSYSIYAAPGDRLKEFATFQRRRFHEDYWALRDVLHRRGKRLRQKHAPANLRRYPPTDFGNGHGPRPGFGAARTGRGF